MKHRLFNSVLFQVLYYIARLVILNLLVIVPSFLFLYLFDLCFKDYVGTIFQYLTLIPTVFYFFPSVCAACHCVINYEMKVSDSIFKEFLKSFRQNFLKGFIYGIVIIVVAELFYNSINFFAHNLDQGAIYILGLILAISFAIMLLVIIFHLPLAICYFEGAGIIGTIKLACMMAFQDLVITLAVVILSALLAYVALSGVDILLVTCVICVPIYLMVKLTFKKYYSVYVRTHKEEKNEEGF